MFAESGKNLNFYRSFDLNKDFFAVFSFNANFSGNKNVGSYYSNEDCSFETVLVLDLPLQDQCLHKLLKAVRPT